MLHYHLRSCDGTIVKFDNLSGKLWTGGAGTERLSGIWVKSGCNQSGDGPGFGEYFPARSLCDGTKPTPSSTPTPLPSATPLWTATPVGTPLPPETPTARPTATPLPTTSPAPSITPTPWIPPGPTLTPTAGTTPTGTPTPTTAVCHVANDGKDATTLIVPTEQAQLHLDHGESIGECPLDCMGIPGGQAVIDACGVCRGDNSTCSDCPGTPNGSAVTDQCGVCGGDGTSCTLCRDKEGASALVDECGVCGGDGSTCRDCAGIPFGTAEIDQCGVCGGNSSTCLDCAGVPNGTSKVDSCGVCGGFDLCVAASAVDACGVPGGNNECLDCAGIPNGGTQIDCCGVCGGDGTSCPDQCTFYDITKIRRRLLRQSKKFNRSIKLYSQRQQSRGQVEEGAKRIKLARRALSTVERLLFEISGTSLKVCDTPYYKSISLGAWKKTVKSRLRVLLTLAKKAQYGAVDACGRYGDGGRSFSVSSSAGAKRLVGQLPAKVCNN